MKIATRTAVDAVCPVNAAFCEKGRLGTLRVSRTVGGADRVIFATLNYRRRWNMSRPTGDSCVHNGISL